jgi:hypothetical protein
MECAMTESTTKLSKAEQKMLDEHNARLRKLQLENGVSEFFNRARGVCVGTGMGGTVEINMRRQDGVYVYAILQPVEAVELINQMAAGIGCHVMLQPRQDFASWRSWKHSTEELEHFRGDMFPQGGGHAPHNKAIEDGGYGSSLPAPEEQAGMPLPILRNENEEAVAVEAPKQRRKSKRVAASS